jgi:putative transposase
MQFESQSIYHIYNQGNNRQLIFFEKRNYLFFEGKMRKHLLPYGQLLAYCLMPNHFHWLFLVDHVIVAKTTLSDSIGILLRSYTRAVNNQESRTGSLFRENTKAKDGWIDGPLTIDDPKLKAQYWNTDGKTCLEYIHQNPVKAGLVSKPEDWPFSSALAFKTREGKGLCNVELARELLSIS